MKITATPTSGFRFSKLPTRGFSLVELLASLAILGIIAAMALPCLAGMVNSSVCVKTKRQAQIVAQAYTSALAAGTVFADVTPAAVIDALSAVGGVRGKGIFSDMTFSVSMSVAEKDALCASGLLAVRTNLDGTAQLEYK